MADAEGQPEVERAGTEIVAGPPAEEEGEGGGDTGDGPQQRGRYAEEYYENPKCNPRLMEIAKPRIALCLYNLENFKRIYPLEMYKAFLKRMKEELAKKPEIIEDEFIQIRDKEEINRYRKAMRKRARKIYLQKINDSKRASMLKILENILVKYITRAYYHPKHIIMTTRLRRISNVVLKELCRIRRIPVPTRDSKKLRAQLMFSTSDFFAYCIDAIYYELQVIKVTDYELLKEDKRQLHECPGYPRPPL